MSLFVLTVWNVCPGVNPREAMGSGWSVITDVPSGGDATLGEGCA